MLVTRPSERCKQTYIAVAGLKCSSTGWTWAWTQVLVQLQLTQIQLQLLSSSHCLLICTEQIAFLSILMAPKKGRKADAKESKGNRDPISSDDAVTFMLEEQEKKEAKRLKRGASTSTSASRKSRKSDEVASSLSIASKPSFIQECSAEDSEEESSDDENKNTCYKQKGRSKKDDSDEDDDVIAAMKGDLCDNTKTALSIMASNPVLASMFRVDPGKIARALKKHKSSRAIADAFEPIPACPGDGQMVPYVAPPHPEPKVWFENLNKNYEAFFAAMRSYRKLILDETYAYLSSYNKEKTESTLQSAIFEKLPKGQHEFPASSKPKWMIWSLSGVLNAHTVLPHI